MPTLQIPPTCKSSTLMGRADTQCYCVVRSHYGTVKSAHSPQCRPRQQIVALDDKQSSQVQPETMLLAMRLKQSYFGNPPFPVYTWPPCLTFALPPSTSPFPILLPNEEFVLLVRPTPSVRRGRPEFGSCEPTECLENQKRQGGHAPDRGLDGGRET
jgi:hypothetical protein